MNILTATNIDQNGNRKTVSFNTAIDRVWMFNQHGVLLNLSNVMFLRTDLNGTEARKDRLASKIKTAGITTDHGLANVLKTETGLVWY